MPSGTSKLSEWDPDFSHSIRGDIEGLDDNDGYQLYGHGDPEGDLKRGNAKRWLFNDRRKAP